jgi:hypothetical protein
MHSIGADGETTKRRRSAFRGDVRRADILHGQLLPYSQVAVRRASLYFTPSSSPKTHAFLMSHLSFWRLFLWFAGFLRMVEGACYYRNGTQQSSDFSPCSSNASDPLHTVCCASWDTCLPIGLCQANKGDYSIWREGCSKQNWDEGGCQELCSNEVIF